MKTIAWLKAFWASLPHQLQAIIVMFVSAFFATFVHVASESSCYTGSCLKHYAGTALTAGFVALRVFYMIPSPPVPPNPTNPANRPQ
jgi:hypothetical protein